MSKIQITHNTFCNSLFDDEISAFTKVSYCLFSSSCYDYKTLSLQQVTLYIFSDMFRNLFFPHWPRTDRK